MIIRTFITLLLLLLAVTPINANEPVRIGISLGLTGKYAEMSAMQMKGFRLWETNVNRSGGILGRKVQLLIYDDKSNTKTAEELYERMILADKVDLVFSPYSSELTEAILPITEKYKYPLIVSGASADRLWQKSYKYVFGVYTPASRYAIGFLEMLTMHGINNVAIIHADDSFSKDIADGTKKWTERYRLKVVLFEGFKKGTENLDEFAKKAKASNAQALIICGHFDESVNMRVSLKRIGWYPNAYFASVGPVVPAFYDRLRTDADYAFSSSQWEHGGLMAPGCGEFYEAFTKTYKEMPSYHAATAYAAGQILETAIKNAKSLNRDMLRDALSAADTMSIIGRYGVDKTGMQIKHLNLIIQWQNGKKEIVWPEEISSAKPKFK